MTLKMMAGLLTNLRLFVPEPSLTYVINTSIILYYTTPDYSNA